MKKLYMFNSSCKRVHRKKRTDMFEILSTSISLSTGFEWICVFYYRVLTQQIKNIIGIGRSSSHLFRGKLYWWIQWENEGGGAEEKFTRRLNCHHPSHGIVNFADHEHFQNRTICYNISSILVGFAIFALLKLFLAATCDLKKILPKISKNF